MTSDPIATTVDQAITDELTTLTATIEATRPAPPPLLLERGFELCGRIDLAAGILKAELGRFFTDDELYRWWDLTGYGRFQDVVRTFMDEREVDRRIWQAEDAAVGTD